MNRRELFRNSLVGAATLVVPISIAPAVASARDFPKDQDAFKELSRADWKPMLLDDHQNQTLIALSELIIPTTDTPGAKEALVNRFLDLQMSIEKPETQREFFATLAYVDGMARERYRNVFLHIAPQQQTDLLNLLAYPHTLVTWSEATAEFSGYEQFRRLKRWIADAYYSSPIGLKELGWNGSFPHGELSGCEGSHKG